MGDEKPVLIDRDGSIQVVTIDRPASRNALSQPVRDGVTQAMRDASEDPAINVIVLTGSGERTFASGADIAEMELRGIEEQREVMRDGGVFNAVWRVPKPVIAAVNGYCLGGGLELALACDIRIAADHAKFGQPEVLLGLIPGGGGTQLLPRVVGVAHALELCMMGEMIDATKALRIGLVHEVVPADQLRSRAMAVARTIAARSTVAVAAAKRAVRGALDRTVEEGRTFEAQLFEQCFTGPDKAEGIRAFLEKRQPHFTRL